MTRVGSQRHRKKKKTLETTSFSRLGSMEVKRQNVAEGWTNTSRNVTSLKMPLEMSCD